MITKTTGLGGPSPGPAVWAKPCPLPARSCQPSSLCTTGVGSSTGLCCVLPCEVGGGIGLCVLRPQGIIHILEVLQVGKLRDSTGQHLEERRVACKQERSMASFLPETRFSVLGTMILQGYRQMPWALVSRPQALRGYMRGQASQFLVVGSLPLRKTGATIGRSGSSGILGNNLGQLKMEPGNKKESHKEMNSLPDPEG